VSVQYLMNLGGLTLRDPSRAAGVIVAMGLPGQALAPALGVVAIANAALFALTNILMPPPGPMPLVFQSPLLFCLIIAVGVLLSGTALTWVGRFFGGQGRFEDVLALLIWLQILRAMVQAVVLVLMFIAPGMAALLVFVAGLYGVWILLHFLKVALLLGSLWRALTVFVAASVAIVLGLVALLSLLGPGLFGIAS
jgi:hypothetical protein